MRERVVRHPGRLSIWLVTIYLLLVSVAAGKPQALAEQKLLANPQNISRLVAKGKLQVSDIPNPHWRTDACQACHRGKPTRKKHPLRESNINHSCNNCHLPIGTHVNIHPVDVVPSAEIKKRMSRELRRTLRYGRGGNKLNCLTCHDLTKQCNRAEFVDKQINPKFIRGAPYRTRTAICYQCHDRKAYQRLNSHDQISDTGVLQSDKCLICHPRIPEELEDGTAVDAELHVDKDYKTICLNCHVWVPHPGGDLPFRDKGGPMHLVVPSPGIARYMKKMERVNELRLPVEEDGRIYCATCHNPHEKGVIKNVAAAKGADEPKRLRSESMCENCHDL